MKLAVRRRAQMGSRSKNVRIYIHTSTIAVWRIVKHIQMQANANIDG